MVSFYGISPPPHLISRNLFNQIKMGTRIFLIAIICCAFTNPSNESGSHKSSIGNFIIAEKYVGLFGNSIRLDGISGKLNSNARSRNIIIHSTKKLATKWTWGCFAVSEEVMKVLWELDLKGCLLYAYK